MIGSVASASGPSRCNRARMLATITCGSAIGVAEPPEHFEPATHRLHGRAEPLERQRLPGRQHDDVIGVVDELGEVVGELAGHRARRCGDEQRAMVRQPGERGDGHRTGDLADRQARRRVAEGARSAPGSSRSSGGRSASRTGRPGYRRAGATSEATCEQDVAHKWPWSLTRRGTSIGGGPGGGRGGGGHGRRRPGGEPRAVGSRGTTR